MTMSVHYIQFVLMLLILQIDTVVGIRCYTCSSLNNEKCTEPFELGPGDSNYISLDVCTACVKVKSTGKRQQGKNSVDEHAIARACLTSVNTTFCTKGYFLQKESDDCFCTTDLCNEGHGGVRFSVVTAGLAMIFTVVINFALVGIY